MIAGVRRALYHPLRRWVERLAPADVTAGLRYLREESGPAFPKRQIRVVRELPLENVLVLAPHPDDEIIGMGAALSGYLDNGSAVRVVYLTDGGGLGDERQEMITKRRMEAESVGRAWGFDQVFWDERDTALAIRPETVSRLRRTLDEFAPDAVFLPSFFDGHFDHFASNLLLENALRRSDDLAVVGYEVWDTLPFPNWVVDTSDRFSRKAEVLRLYETPMQTTDFVSLTRFRGNVHFTLHVDSRAEAAREGHAEAFLRLDAGAWRRALSAYLEVLRRSRSPLAQRFALSRSERRLSTGPPVGSENV